MTVLSFLSDDFIPGTYDIGFYNTLDGRNDETEFEAQTAQELSDLFDDFCAENGFANDTVQYVERVAD